MTSNFCCFFAQILIEFTYFFCVIFHRKIEMIRVMSYMQMAQLDVLNLLKGINTENDYADFRNMLARYFADKAQKQIDALWDQGIINEQTIEEWGNERMRTPYRYAVHRS